MRQNGKKDILRPNVPDIFPETYSREFLKPSWRPLVMDGDGTSGDSKFCGLPWLTRDEDWPKCGTCGKPMQFMLQINLSTVPPDAKLYADKSLLQLWYCVRACNFSPENRLDPAAKSKFVRIIPLEGEAQSITAPDSGAGLVIGWGTFPAKRIVGWEKQRLEFPHIDQWETILGTDLTEKINADLEAHPRGMPDHWLYPEKGDKLGGWARLHFGTIIPKCPICASPMDLIFQVQSDDNIPYLWRPRDDIGTPAGRPWTTAHISNGTGYITQCPTHRNQVAFTWDFTAI